jgi:alkanesulfonate monooxygenase SsuD/methylene tetrahydromethanopterin reductase-like flavin-dependent oxidoreductase (luciferase family)
VRLSFRYDLRVPAIAGDPQDQYRCAVEQVAWADQIGVAAIYFGDHHGAADGYLPAPAVFGAAVAVATRRLQIRISALAGAVYHPLHLAEQLAVLDLLSSGRLHVTVGLGYVPSEFSMFGVVRSERVALVNEILEVLPRAWTGEPFLFRGTEVLVRPRPTPTLSQRLYLGANTAAAAHRAARLGVAFDPVSDEVYEVYALESSRLGRTVPPGPNRTDMQFVFVTDDPDRDWPLVAPHVLAYNNSYAAFQTERKPEERNFVPLSDPADVIGDPRYNLWTPEECVARFSSLGADQELVIQPLLGGLPPELSWASLRRLEADVLPHLGALR